MTTVEIHDRQTTALILFTRLGNRYQWGTWLNRWASDSGRNECLRRAYGIQLLPFITDKHRTYYAVTEIEKFVEAALKADSDLGPMSSIKPSTAELDCRWLDTRIPWRARKIYRYTSATKSGSSCMA
jgi:hypothetical protein